MRQTLFYLPHEFWGVPLVGVGWVLLAWTVFSVCVLLYALRRQGWGRETASYLPVLCLVAAFVAWVLPNVESRDADGAILGLPMRGYGLLLLVGIVAGIALAAHLGRRAGWDHEVIYSVSFWMIVAGIAGARAFYVVQYWPEFERPTRGATLIEILKFTEGGLVIYGALIGGVLAMAVFAWKRRLAVLRLADVLAPGAMLGLAIGRLGCLLNGCCYGGLVPAHIPGIVFPRYASVEQRSYSPAYFHQLTLGLLHGIHLAQGSDGIRVDGVRPGSEAERSGLKAGAVVRSLNGQQVRDLNGARAVLQVSGPELTLESRDGDTHRWTIGELPLCSLRIHATQIYAAVNAALILFVLYSFFPFRTRDGQVLAWMATLYPITRFLLEWVRDDEPGRFGTPLTIAQWVSIATIVPAMGLWIHLARGRLEARTTLREDQ